MSSSINKRGEITLTRGDSFMVQVAIKKDGEYYTPVDGDVVRFALKHPKLNAAGTEYADQEPLILKPIPIETMILELEPADTKDLGFGEYVYDMEITFGADGRVDTFITEKKFLLTKEVH